MNKYWEIGKYLETSENPGCREQCSEKNIYINAYIKKDRLQETT